MRTINKNSGIEILRIISALSVMVYHTEGAKWFLGLSGLFSNTPFKRYWPVTFGPFLALSLFILVKQNLLSTEFKLKPLMLKRFKRIYPLYIFISLLGIFIFPFFIQFKGFPFPVESRGTITLLMLSLNPEIVSVLFGDILFINIFWFLGVQEKLYLLVTGLYKVIQKKTLIILFSFLAATILLRYVLMLSKTESILDRLVGIFPIEYGLIGAIFAFLYTRLEKSNFFKSKILTILNIALIVFSLKFPHEGHFLSHSYFGILISILIMNLSAMSFHSEIINKIAKLSYSFYCVHIIYVIVFLNFLFKDQKRLSLIDELILYTGILVLGSLSSLVLHHFVEKRFFAKTAK